mmetsp:Transcript_24783/g.66872  ORF Transcript_24783/g.66872 Transcript_24783/m.66872 type:complete len:179 (-) Transcript_24783:1735-2271(-)
MGAAASTAPASLTKDEAKEVCAKHWPGTPRFEAISEDGLLSKSRLLEEIQKSMTLLEVDIDPSESGKILALSSTPSTTSRQLIDAIEESPQAVSEEDGMACTAAHHYLWKHEVDPEVLKAMLKAEPGLLEKTDQHEFTPVHRYFGGNSNVSPTIINILMNADPTCLQMMHWSALTRRE